LNNCVDENLTARCSLCSSLNECGTKWEQIFLLCKSFSRINVAISLLTPSITARSLMVICLSWATISVAFSTFSFVHAETGCPGGHAVA
jgi:hypothetical protein